MKKVVIIGGVAGGATAAARIRRLDEQANIVIFDRGPHVSFSNCALPFYLSGVVEKSEKLVLMNPTSLKARFNIEARTNSEVIQINRQKKTVTVFNHIEQVSYEESYDKLILSPGAAPTVPPLEGVSLPHVYTVRHVADIERLKQAIDQQDAKRVVVIGGGFIGVEVAENIKLAQKEVVLVEHGSHILKTYDFSMAQILQKELHDQGVQVIVNDKVTSIANEQVTLGSGQQLEADVVVLAIGVKPETKLAVEAGLVLGQLGGIKVNQNYLTNDPNIYAIGDAIEVYHRILNRKVHLALAGPAHKQARKAADHMYGMTSRNKGVIGSSSIHVFSLNAASTGITEKMAEAAGFDYDSVYILAPDRVSIMPDSHVIHLKLIYEKTTGKILGAQAIGKGNVDKRIDVIATAIMMDGTIYDLQDLELTYSPMYSTAKDVTNIAGLVAGNIMSGHFKQVQVSQVRELVQSGAFILDVRETAEVDNGKVKGAMNIPLSQLRDRMDELPKNKAIYVYCRSAQRSYNAVRVLMGSGFEEVYNISGSFLGISLYEYFTDVTTEREPIVTKYNFK